MFGNHTGLSRSEHLDLLQEEHTPIPTWASLEGSRSVSPSGEGASQRPSQVMDGLTAPQSHSGSRSVAQPLRALVRQQACVAALGLRALAGVAVDRLMDEVVALVAENLNVEFCKVLQLLPDGNSLLLRSGVGWNDGLVGRATVDAGVNSQAGYTLLHSDPVVVEDLRTETRFSGPPLLLDHGVVSGMSVVVAGRSEPYGVLGVHSRERRLFTEDDANFIQSVANVLASAIERERAEEELCKAYDELDDKVRQRTAELALANERLKLEIAERKQAEVEREELLARIRRLAENGHHLADVRGKHLERLNTLIRASAGVFSAMTMDELLRNLVDAAMEVTGARLGIAGRAFGEDSFVFGLTSSARDESACALGRVLNAGGIHLKLLENLASIRLTDVELRKHPAWKRLPPEHAKLRGLLGVRLIGREGQASGLVMVSDKEQGDFTAEDEALLMQLAALASLSLQHIQATSKIENERARLQAVLDHMPEGVMIASADGRVVMASSSAERLFGQSIPQGIPLRDMPTVLGIKSPDGGRLQAEDLPLESALRGETIVGHELRVARPDGRWMDVLVSAVPLVNAYGRVTEAVAVLADITRVKELERQKDLFLSVASHELKTPLTAIKGYAQLLLRQAGQMAAGSEEEAALLAIESAATRMQRLANDLMDASRMKLGAVELNRELVDLVELARQVIQQQEISTENHSLRLLCSHPRILGRWDRDRLAQVLSNLIVNAIKYSPEGGPIEITISRKDKSAQVSVKDQGIGIPEQELNRVFDPFYRTGEAEKLAVQGLGLGLFICRQTVLLHGGSISASSKPGAGSTFSFSLPL